MTTRFRVGHPVAIYPSDDKREAQMGKWILILTAITMMIGCSKGGAKSHLMDGAQSQDPQIVDRNLPGPDGNIAP
jgi:hypothetical protein